MLFSDFVVAQSITYRENIYYITVYPISKITINIYSLVYGLFSIMFSNWSMAKTTIYQTLQTE